MGLPLYSLTETPRNATGHGREEFCDILLSRNLPVRQDVFTLLLSIETEVKDKCNSSHSLKFMFILPFDFLLDVPR